MSLPHQAGGAASRPASAPQPAAAAPPRAGRWWMLAVLWLARANMGFQFQALPAVAPLLMRDLELNYAQAGLLFGLFMLPGVLLSIPAGLLGLAVGDRGALLVNLGCMAAGGGLAGWGRGFATVALGRVLSGVGGCMSNVQITKMTSDWFAGRELATAMGILLVVWPVSQALALVVLAGVATAASWPVALLLTAAPPAACMALVALCYRDPPGRPAAEAPARQALAIGPREAGLALMTGLNYALVNGGLVAFISFAPALLAEQGYTVVMAATLASLLHWSRPAGLPLGGFLADRTGRPAPQIVLSCLVSAAAIAAVPHLAQPGWALVLIGVTVGLPMAPLMALPAEVLRPEARRVGYGLFYTVLYGGYFLLPTLAGWLRDRTGDPAATAHFSALLVVLTVVSYLAFRALRGRAGRREARGDGA